MATTKFSNDTDSITMLDNITKGLSFNVPNVNIDGEGYTIPAEVLALMKNAPTIGAVTAISKPSINLPNPSDVIPSPNINGSFDYSSEVPDLSLTIKDITEPKLMGPATFDHIMGSFHTHLEKELDAGRITGADYANQFGQLLPVAMQLAIQFELDKYKTDIEKYNTEKQFALNVFNTEAQLKLNIYQANISKYSALSQVQLSKYQTETTYEVARFNAEANFELNKSKTFWELITANIQAISANVQLAVTKVQLAIAQAQAHNAKAQYANTVSQLAIADAQYALVQQQRDSFMAKDRNDAAKLQVDSWAVMKGIDEGIQPPTNLQNGAIDKSLNKIYEVLDMKGN